jgi:transposase
MAVVTPKIWLSRSFRAQAEVACSGSTTLCHLLSTFVFPCLRSSALLAPAFACSLPGCEITAVRQSDHVLTITAPPTAPTARCPHCGISSQRIHRYYTRRPRDLPRWESTVRLGLHVRRFRCLNASCTAHTFAERWPQVVRPAAQRTVRLTTALQQLGLALGGEAGARLGATLHLPTSPDTVRRLVRQLPDPMRSTPAILGGDEWAVRRGHPYGPLFVELERHRPIDLLPDRTADTLAAWLRAHPGVISSSRDRSTAYARGATLGAPEAQPVLDRWHLVRHLREALERLLDRLHQRLAAMLTARQAAAVPTSSLIEARSLRRSTTDQIARQARRARRLARYQEVRALHVQGVSTRHMARQLRMSRTTVIRSLRPDAFPERAQSRRLRLLDPYVAYRQKPWDAGCHNGVQRWRAIHARGFPGTRRMGSNWGGLRRALERGRPSAAGRHPALPKEPAVRLLSATAAGAAPPVPAPRPLVWVLLRPEEALPPSNGEILRALHHDKDLDTASTLTQRFRQMMRERVASTLDRGLRDCQASGRPELVTFASGLPRERAAVQAALTLPDSNGQVEGQIPKLKRLTRQSYGRAKLELLRQRMRHAA